jgi:hypothetical protein
MTPGKKNTVSTILFYVILLPVIYLLDRYSPSGPCTPGLGMLVFILTPLMVAFGFAISIAGLARGRRSFKGPAIVNGIAVLVLGILLLRNA